MSATVSAPSSEELDALRAAVRRAVASGDGPRAHLLGEPGTDDPLDRALWRRLTDEVGVAGLLVPEAMGGDGAGVAAAAVVAGELGATLAPVPFLSTVALATPALLTVAEPGEYVSTCLAGLAEGRATATLAFAGDDSWEPRDSPVAATSDDGAWTLQGHAPYVVDGASSDVVIVCARTPDGPALFAVPGVAAGLDRRLGTTLDLTRPLDRLAFDATPATLLASGPDVVGGLLAVLDIARTLLCAEQMGAARSCLDASVEYAKIRVQFDRPIGSFQAIKHTLVDVLLHIELARSGADAAVLAADAYLRDPSSATAAALATAASLAKASCSDAYLHTAEETLHVYGGIGFTWEHDAHLHFRRATSSQLFLGTPAEQRERLASRAGLG